MLQSKNRYFMLIITEDCPGSNWSTSIKNIYIYKAARCGATTARRSGFHAIRMPSIKSSTTIQTRPTTNRTLRAWRIRTGSFIPGRVLRGHTTRQDGRGPKCHYDQTDSRGPVRGVSNHTTRGEVGASGDGKLMELTSCFSKRSLLLPYAHGAPVRHFTKIHNVARLLNGRGEPSAFSPPDRDWGKMVSETDSS